MKSGVCCLFFGFVLFFLAALTSKQRAFEKTNKNILVFWVQSNAHSLCAFLCWWARWTHCHLSAFSPEDQLSVTQSPVWLSTAVWPWLNFTEKIVAKVWESPWSDAIQDKKNKNTSKAVMVEMVVTRSSRIQKEKYWQEKLKLMKDEGVGKRRKAGVRRCCLIDKQPTPRSAGDLPFLTICLIINLTCPFLSIYILCSGSGVKEVTTLMMQLKKNADTEISF